MNSDQLVSEILDWITEWCGVSPGEASTAELRELVKRHVAAETK